MADQGNGVSDSMMLVEYSQGYKYQIKRDYMVDVGIALTVNTQFLVLQGDGNLFIRSGYAFDGPSGPTFDTKNFMRGSLVHDALYQLMREGHIPESYREHADRLLQRMCVEDGMTSLRAWWVYKGVRFGGKSSATRSSGKSVLYAP